MYTHMGSWGHSNYGSSIICTYMYMGRWGHTVAIGSSMIKYMHTYRKMGTYCSNQGSSTVCTWNHGDMVIVTVGSSTFVHVHRNIIIGVHVVDQVHNKDRDRVITITCTVLDVTIESFRYIYIKQFMM